MMHPSVVEQELLRAIATRERPRHVERLTVDRAALRQARGGRAEVVGGAP